MFPKWIKVQANYGSISTFVIFLMKPYIKNLLVKKFQCWNEEKKKNSSKGLTTCPDAPVKILFKIVFHNWLDKMNYNIEPLISIVFFSNYIFILHPPLLHFNIVNLHNNSKI